MEKVTKISNLSKCCLFEGFPGGSQWEPRELRKQHLTLLRCCSSLVDRLQKGVHTMADKRDVRLTVFVTAKMDDQLDHISDLQGLSKHEVIRLALANYIGGWNQSVELVKQLADESLLSKIGGKDIVVVKSENGKK